MDGLFHGNPYEQMDDLGAKPPIFGFNTHIFFLGKFEKGTLLRLGDATLRRWERHQLLVVLRGGPPWNEQPRTPEDRPNPPKRKRKEIPNINFFRGENVCFREGWGFWMLDSCKIILALYGAVCVWHMVWLNYRYRSIYTYKNIIAYHFQRNIPVWFEWYFKFQVVLVYLHLDHLSFGRYFENDRWLM